MPVPNISTELVAEVALGERLIGEGRRRAFLSSQTIYRPVSSNVHSARYDALNAVLYVTYKTDAGAPGESWAYAPITLDRAEEFAQAPSAGTWLWDNVRVRGTKHEHQCLAWKIT